MKNLLTTAALAATLIGTFAGAKAARQALDATMNKISLKKYAENHPELAKALEKFGTK